MSNSEIHKCECGFTWEHGKNGAHNCAPYYRVRIAELEDQQKAVAYCTECNAVGMSNCGNFDECGGAKCVTCKRPLHIEQPKLSSDEIKSKADGFRQELQRIKDNPQDDEERALKIEVLDKMSDPNLWYDDVVLMAGYGAQEFSRGYRAAHSKSKDQHSFTNDCKSAFESWATKEGTYDLRPAKVKMLSVSGVPYDGYVRPYLQDRTVYTYQGFVAGVEAVADLRATVTDEQIKEWIDEIDFSSMVTSDDIFYLIARKILSITPISKE